VLLNMLLLTMLGTAAAMEAGAGVPVTVAMGTVDMAVMAMVAMGMAAMVVDTMGTATAAAPRLTSLCAAMRLAFSRLYS